MVARLTLTCACMCVCVCVRVCERDTGRDISRYSRLSARAAVQLAAGHALRTLPGVRVRVGQCGAALGAACRTPDAELHCDMIRGRDGEKDLNAQRIRSDFLGEAMHGKSLSQRILAAEIGAGYQQSLLSVVSGQRHVSILTSHGYETKLTKRNELSSKPH